MRAHRILPLFLLAGVLASPAIAHAQADEDTLEPTEEPRRPPMDLRNNRARTEELRQELLEEVRRELERTREELREEVGFLENEADARAWDAEQLRELREAVNLLQLHGYYRMRGDMYHRLDLGRGADPAGFELFPRPQGTPYNTTANMRLRLNPILRISDSITLKTQFDVLDNVVLGSNPLSMPFYDPYTPAAVLSSRTAPGFINVRRVWAEVDTAVGVLAFGRQPLHFGEGMVWNDGDCLDCDFGTNLDRIQFTAGPLLGGHRFTLGVDMLASGATTRDIPALDLWGGYGQPFQTQELDNAYRFSLQVSRLTPPQEIRQRLDRGDWVFNYALLAAYRFRHSAAPALETLDPDVAPSQTLAKIDASLWEANGWGQVLRGRLRLATELAGVFGGIENRIAGGEVFQGQSLNFLQGAAVLRGQYAFLRQDALLAGLDLGWASGDRRPGMGARPGRPGSGPDGNTAEGDIDGRQFECTPAGCPDNSVTNFRMNPDFRIDQILWRNLFTRITDAYFARGEVRYKPGGRPSGGGERHGLELSGAVIYSHAVFPASAPGNAGPLGVEFNASVTYTSQDRFFAGLVYGALLPMSGLNNPTTGQDASLAQIFRLIGAVTF